MNHVTGGLLRLEANKPPAAGADDPLNGTSNQEVMQGDRVYVSCPHCEAILMVRRTFAGSGVRCKRCTQKFRLPTTLSGPPNKLFMGSIANTEPGSQFLSVENHGAGTATARLIAQLAEFVASHGELQLAQQRLERENDDLRNERQSNRANLQETSTELAAIRTALGTTSAHTSPALAIEGLRIKVHTLRDQNKKLLDDHIDDRRLISELEGKVRELLPLPDKCAALQVQVQDKDLQLDAIRAEQDRLLKNLAAENAAVVTKDGEILLLQAQLAKSKNETSTATEASLQAQQRLDRSEAALREVRADLTRSSDERLNAFATIEQLQKLGAEREHAIAIQLAKLTTELESSQAALYSSEKARQGEVGTLAAEVDSLKKAHELLVEERESARLLVAELQASNSELSDAQEQLVTTHRQQLEREQHEREKLTSELLDVRAEYADLIRGVQERISDAVDVPSVPVASEEDLKDVDISAQIFESYNFAESDYLARLMAETLEIGAVVVGGPIKDRTTPRP